MLSAAVIYCVTGSLKYPVHPFLPPRASSPCLPEMQWVCTRLWSAQGKKDILFLSWSVRRTKMTPQKDSRDFFGLILRDTENYICGCQWELLAKFSMQWAEYMTPNCSLLYLSIYYGIWGCSIDHSASLCLWLSRQCASCAVSSLHRAIGILFALPPCTTYWVWKDISACSVS